MPPWGAILGNIKWLIKILGKAQLEKHFYGTLVSWVGCSNYQNSSSSILNN
jgi:hypothetical protein